ncbi:MAG: hypothetical protein REI64_15755 [Pedobacter sp.]|uniref:hypothetical protein n=1 Tax=Pedobacter sp. TaxID=1411316 RepID=UPI0028098ADE|nr:hypothetical protein [Pedobacter sp.]MDQ8006256.1 hypothetical protein [Pedobacter sp.]
MNNLYHFKQNYKSISILFLLLIIALGKSQVFAQTTVTPTVNITINISPPYSPFYSDYSAQNANKVLLIIQNLSATQKNIKLTGELQGDNGIRISTKSNYVPLQPIVLGPNETKQLNGLALKDIFDLNTLNVYGVDKVKIVQTSRLPEGNYSFCIKAVDMANNQVLSAAAPMGCSSINIFYPDAPVLINPTANATIPAIAGQSFVWVNYLPLAGINYEFQVAEMPSDVRTDPNQALNATSRLLIQRTVVNSTTTILSPSDPPLKIGKRYAWRVIASDPTGKIVFKNKGISTAAEFRYGEELPSFFTINTPATARRITNLNDLVFDWNFIENVKDIGFFDGIARRQPAYSSSKYELHVVRVKTLEEKKADSLSQANARKSSAIRTLNVAPVAVKDLGVIVPTNNTTISYKTAQQLKDYLKDANSYEWYLKHVASGTVSETRQFAVKYEKAIVNYTITIAGDLKYNFGKNYASKKDKQKANPNAVLSEEEKGYALANKNIQVLKVTLLAPKYKVNRKVTKIVNGQQVSNFEMQDSIALVSDLMLYPYGTPKLSASAVIANATTNALGNFKIEVPIEKAKFKVLDSNAVVLNGTKPYALVEGLVVRVNDSRFSDPNWFIVPDANKPLLDLAEQTVEIYGYNANVKLASSSQRDFKGKLYVLRNSNNLLKGEVANMVGITKEIPTYTTMTNAKGKKIITGSSLATYTVVGVNNIDAKATGELNSAFTNLAVAGDKVNDGYTVYFEPADEQDGLFFNPRYVSNGQGKGNTFTATNFANRNLSQEVSFAPQFISMKISGRYVYHWKDADGKTNNKLPLPEGTSLTLVKGNMVGKDFFKDGTVLKDDRIIGSTTVKKNGEYSFDIGLTDYNDFNKAGAHLVILVSDTYYYSQPYTITYNQNENIKLPELTATVRQYNYISKVGYMEAPLNLVRKDNINVYLCRKISEEKANAARYVERPVNIGNPDRNYFKKTIESNGEQYEIIDMTTSSGEGGKVGEFMFKRLVVSKDAGEKYYIIAESISTSQDNYVTKEAWDLTSTDNMDGIKSGGSLGGVFTDDQKIGKLDFNIEYAHIPLTPLEPYVDGAVYPSSNASTSVLSGVFVEMFDMTGLEGTANNQQIADFLKNKKPVDDDITQTNGRFLFEKVNAKANGWKLLRLTKKGFLITYVKLNSGKPFVKGQRGNLQKVFMDLPANLAVYVVNKAGKRVDARVIVGDDFSWGDYNSLYVTGALVQSPTNSVRFTIIPNDRVNYKTTTQYQTIQKPLDEKSLQNITLTVGYNEHVLNVLCKIKGTNKYLASKVTVLNTTNFTQRQLTLGNPYTEVTIPAAGTQFELKVVPDDVNYTIAKTQVISDGTSPVSITVEVEPAATLTIKVTEEYNKFVQNGLFGTFEKAKQKSSYFSYFIDGMDEDEYELVNPYGSGIFATATLASTDTRTLRRLPLSKYIYVGATKEGYIGDSKLCYSYGAKTMAVTLDLKLSDLDIKAVHGFPVELTAAVKQSNGQYLISGRLNPSAGNNINLKVKSTTGKLEFYKVLIDVIKISGRGTLAVPANGMTFVQNSIDARLFDKYDVKITSKGGLSLKQERELGSILGKVAVDLVSFSKGVSTSSSDDLGDKNYLYLNKESANYALITSLPADKTTPYFSTFSTATSDMLAGNYMVSTQAKSKPIFYGADDIAITPQGKVTLSSAGMEFTGAITPNLEAVALVNPAIAKYKLSSSDFSSSEEIPFNIKLRDWELKVNTWKYGAKGLFVAGDLFTNGLTVPFDKLQIFNNKIGFGNFNVTSLKILGAFPITINGSKALVSFGYDRGYAKEKGAWSLSVLAKPTNDQQTYLAGLKGLDDLLPTDVIQIKNINLYDTGNDADTRLILDENQPAVTLNTISKFKPGSIWGDASSITIRGDLNMEIPGFTGLDAVVYDLIYRNENGVLKHKHEKTFKNVGLDTKGMLVKFSDKPEDQKFNGGELFLRGVLMDKDPSASYQIAVDLTKTKDETKLAIPQKINGNIPRVYLSYNTNYLNHAQSYNAKVANTSESYLNGANGFTTVTNNQWNYFTFQGDLTGASGVNPSPMSFTIKGDVVANSANVGVQNMDAGGVKGLSIVYDFKEKALIGSGHVNQVTSFATMDLDLEMKLGSSNWYMFANGTADIPHSPFTKVGVGFMVGNSNITPSQKASFYKHFDGRDLPDKAEETFGSIKGILFILSAEMPIPKLPQFDLPLDPVAKIELKHGLYATAYFKADFPSDPEKISFTIGGRVGAFVKLSAAASIGLACAGVSLGADMNFTLVGKVEPFAPSFYASAAVALTLKGEAYVGAGICNSSCQTPCWDAGLFEVCSPIPCVRVGLNKQVKVSFGANIKNASFGFEEFKVDFF